MHQFSTHRFGAWPLSRRRASAPGTPPAPRLSATALSRRSLLSPSAMAALFFPRWFSRSSCCCGCCRHRRRHGCFSARRSTLRSGLTSTELATSPPPSPKRQLWVGLAAVVTNRASSRLVDRCSDACNTLGSVAGAHSAFTATTGGCRRRTPGKNMQESPRDFTYSHTGCGKVKVPTNKPRHFENVSGCFACGRGRLDWRVT